MQKISSFHKILLGLVLLLVFLFIFNSINDENVVKQSVLDKSTVYYEVSTSSLKLRVSGVLEATDKAIVSAKTPGIIKEYYVDIGAFVNQNALLMSQSTPVADARLELTDKEASLTAAQLAWETNTVNFDSIKTQAIDYSAQDIASIMSVSNDNRVVEAKNQALAADQSSVVNLLDSLHFVNTNRNLFTAKSIEEYEQVTTDLYGSIPKYFQGAITNPDKPSEYLLKILNTFSNASTTSALDIINLTTLIETQIKSLISVYEGAETDVFNRTKIKSTDAEYLEYIENRSTLVSDLSYLIAARSSLQKAVDISISEAASQEVSVVVADIDKKFADSQVLFTSQITKATEAVVSARRRAVAAEVDLGNLRAPFAGQVTARFKNTGEYVSVGEPVLQLIGTSGKELKVTVPAIFASSLEVGQIFETEGLVAGVVERFSSVSEGNTVAVVVNIADSELLVGDTVIGSIVLESTDSVFYIPRSYLHFSNNGPQIESAAGKNYPVEIVYDDGEKVYVTGPELSGVSLKPAYSLSFD